MSDQNLQNFLDMKVSDYPKLTGKTIEPPHKAYGKMKVPPTCIIRTYGPAGVQDRLRFLQMEGAGISVALVCRNREVGTRKKHPHVFAGYMDDKVLGNGDGQSVQLMFLQSLINAGKGFSSVRALVVQGDLDPTKLGPIVQELQQNGIPLELHVGTKTAILTIDLGDGRPVMNPDVLKGLAECKPTLQWQKTLERHHLTREKTYMEACNLTKGEIPSNYVWEGPTLPEVLPVIKSVQSAPSRPREKAVSVKAQHSGERVAQRPMVRKDNGKFDLDAYLNTLPVVTAGTMLNQDSTWQLPSGSKLGPQPS